MFSYFVVKNRKSAEIRVAVIDLARLALELAFLQYNGRSFDFLTLVLYLIVNLIVSSVK